MYNDLKIKTIWQFYLLKLNHTSFHDLHDQKNTPLNQYFAMSHYIEQKYQIQKVSIQQSYLSLSIFFQKFLNKKLMVR